MAEPFCSDFTLVALNENTLRLDLASKALSSQSIMLLAGCQKKLQEAFPHQLIDCVISYDSLLIYYDCLNNSASTMYESVHDCLNVFFANHEKTNTAVEHHRIPVYYGKEVGLDLERLAQQKQISCEELIAHHTASCYTVYAIGFAPGFTYLGFVSELLATPRLESPRPQVQAGSVGIAETQTGIYPADSPGGWNIIGKTPISMLNTDKSPGEMCPFHTGDSVQFYAISREEYDELKAVP